MSNIEYRISNKRALYTKSERWNTRLLYEAVDQARSLTAWSGDDEAQLSNLVQRLLSLANLHAIRQATPFHRGRGFSSQKTGIMNAKIVNKCRINYIWTKKRNFCNPNRVRILSCTS
jgi:hypothetical protein